MRIERKRCFSSFLRFINSRPDLSGHIRELTLALLHFGYRDGEEECCCDEHETPEEAWPRLPQLDLAAFTAALPKLKGLKALKLEEIVVRLHKPTPSGIPEAHPLRARKLEALVLEDVGGEHDGVPALLDVLDALSPPSIGLLAFDYIAPENDDGVTLEDKLRALWGERAPLTVQRLSLSYDGRASTAEHLRFYEQKMFRPRCLQSLKIRCESWSVKKQIFAFLRTCGSKNFEQLDLDIVPLVDMEVAAGGYRLVSTLWTDSL